GVVELKSSYTTTQPPTSLQSAATARLPLPSLVWIFVKRLSENPELRLIAPPTVRSQSPSVLTMKASILVPVPSQASMALARFVADLKLLSLRALLAMAVEVTSRTASALRHLGMGCIRDLLWWCACAGCVP